MPELQVTYGFLVEERARVSGQSLLDLAMYQRLYLLGQLMVVTAAEQFGPEQGTTEYDWWLWQSRWPKIHETA